MIILMRLVGPIRTLFASKETSQTKEMYKFPCGRRRSKVLWQRWKLRSKQCIQCDQIGQNLLLGYFFCQNVDLPNQRGIGQNLETFTAVG